MAEVGTAYVRIRPVLEPDERDALEKLAENARSLADGLDSYLSNFANRPALEEDRPE